MDGTLVFILAILLLFTVWNNVVNMLKMKSFKFISVLNCMLLILRTRKILEMNSRYFLIVSSINVEGYKLSFVFKLKIP